MFSLVRGQGQNGQFVGVPLELLCSSGRILLPIHDAKGKSCIQPLFRPKKGQTAGAALGMASKLAYRYSTCIHYFPSHVIDDCLGSRSWGRFIKDMGVSFLAQLAGNREACKVPGATHNFRLIWGCLSFIALVVPCFSFSSILPLPIHKSS